MKELEALRELKTAIDGYLGIPRHKFAPDGGAERFENGSRSFVRVWFNNEYPFVVSEEAARILWPGIAIEDET